MFHNSLYVLLCIPNKHTIWTDFLWINLYLILNSVKEIKYIIITTYSGIMHEMESIHPTLGMLIKPRLLIHVHIIKTY